MLIVRTSLLPLISLTSFASFLQHYRHFSVPTCALHITIPLPLFFWLYTNFLNNYEFKGRRMTQAYLLIFNSSSFGIIISFIIYIIYLYILIIVINNYLLCAYYIATNEMKLPWSIRCMAIAITLPPISHYTLVCACCNIKNITYCIVFIKL